MLKSDDIPSKEYSQHAGIIIRVFDTTVKNQIFTDGSTIQNLFVMHGFYLYCLQLFQRAEIK